MFILNDFRDYKIHKKRDVNPSMINIQQKMPKYAFSIE